VTQRTAELRAANEHLQHELEERQHVEEALRRKDEELRMRYRSNSGKRRKLATME
jgi:C4-dicarboxylate-specific signal transduction histidine kinase